MYGLHAHQDTSSPYSSGELSSSVPPSSHPPLSRHASAASTASSERFNVSTIMPEEDNHPTGWKVAIHLDGADAAGCARSGEVLRGSVQVLPVEGATQVPIASLVVRGYWQGVTVYSSHTAPAPVKLKSGVLSLAQLKSAAVNAHTVTIERAEYHRGYLGDSGEGTELFDVREGVVEDAPLDDEVPPSPQEDGKATVAEIEHSQDNPTPTSPAEEPSLFRSYPFSFILPTTTRTQFANPSLFAPEDRSRLMATPRCPPPSFDSGDMRNGIVEYIVEVLLRTDTPEEDAPKDGELPSFRASFAASGDLSSRGLLRSTPSVLVKRITFPFEPMDRDQVHLYSAWCNPVLNPPLSLGRDPRDELGGTKLATKVESEEISNQNGGGEKWTTYGRTVVARVGSLGRAATSIYCEVSLPFPAMVTRHSLSLPMLLHLRQLAPTKSFLSSKVPNKPIAIENVTFILYERLLTRSGRAARPTMALKELRRSTVALDAASTSSTHPYATSPTASSSLSLSSQPLLLPTSPTSSLSLPLTFDLQSPLTPSSHSLRTCPLTFRIPNLELEYILLITLKLDSSPSSIVLCRVPIQVIAGDDDEAPAFESVVADAGGVREGQETRRETGSDDAGLPGY